MLIEWDSIGSRTEDRHAAKAITEVIIRTRITGIWRMDNSKWESVITRLIYFNSRWITIEIYQSLAAISPLSPRSRRNTCQPS